MVLEKALNDQIIAVVVIVCYILVFVQMNRELMNRVEIWAEIHQALLWQYSPLSQDIVYSRQISLEACRICKY